MNQNNGIQGNQLTNNGDKSFFTNGGEVKSTNSNNITSGESSLNKIKNMSTRNNIIILVVIIVIAIFAFNWAKSPASSSDDNTADVHTPYPNMMVNEGTVKDVFGGTNNLTYSFNTPDTASTTMVGDDDSLLRIMDGGVRKTTIYFAYEGSKSFTPADYITYMVSPHVPVIDIKEIKTIGGYDWQLAETAGSNWYVTSLYDGLWIIAIETKKDWIDQAKALVESFEVK